MVTLLSDVAAAFDRHPNWSRSKSDVFIVVEFVFLDKRH